MHLYGLLFKAVGIAMFAFFAGVTAPASAAAPTASQQAGNSNLDDPDRKQALQLYEQHKMGEAAALLEKIVARYPQDVVAHERLGGALLSRADTQTDPNKRRADRLHARAELLRAKELGDNSDLCNMLLAGLPEDGSESAFSANKEVDAAMARGEAAFANGEWENAIKEYSRAFALDPKLYLAAVDIGDTYFRLKKIDQAGEWFGKAIQIDPNQEVAYRYWGDALLAEGKMKEAREKFIQGLVAYPYKAGSGSWAGLHNWVTRNNLKLKQISIQLPQAPTVGADGHVNITLDASSLDKKDDSGAAWMMYPMERALWRSDKFAKEYPQEKSYRHSLKEEASALSGVASVYEELQQKKKARNPDPALALLSQVKADGLIEPLNRRDRRTRPARTPFSFQGSERCLGF